VSTLKMIKAEVVTKAGEATWAKKVQTFFVGLFVVLLGLGVCGVGVKLLLAEKTLGLWIGLPGVIICISGATIWDSELVTGAFKSVGSWLGNLIGGVVRGVRGQSEKEPPANG
jgi:hypothetical protein